MKIIFHPKIKLKKYKPMTITKQSPMFTSLPKPSANYVGSRKTATKRFWVELHWLRQGV